MLYLYRWFFLFSSDHQSLTNPRNLAQRTLTCILFRQKFGAQCFIWLEYNVLLLTIEFSRVFIKPIYFSEYFPNMFYLYTAIFNTIQPEYILFSWEANAVHHKAIIIKTLDHTLTFHDLGPSILTLFPKMLASWTGRYPSTFASSE